MLTLFQSIKNRFRVRFDSISIDNWIFRLHYYATTTIFLIATILVTSRQYIGDHIKCIAGIKKDYVKAVENYCFFNSTYTVRHNRTLNFNDYGLLSYFGLPGEKANYQIRYHRYYQWVPFVLFGQAIMFYLTHLLWKNLEGKRIEKMIHGLTYAAYAASDKSKQIGSVTVPSKQEIEKCINRIKTAFFERIIVDKSWARWYFFCEVLNVLHVILEVYITDKFLGGEFKSLGTNVARNGYKALDDVFPKASRCQFYIYGPSGTIQPKDVLCILALNIIHEKIYIFLWFWFLFLFIASCLTLWWRLCSALLYRSSTTFNQLVFGFGCQRRLYPWHCKLIAKNFGYADWLLLKYLSKNLDGTTFKQLFVTMSEELEESKPLCMMPLRERMGPKYE